MSLADKLITRRKTRRSVRPSESADQLPAGPILSTLGQAENAIEVQTFRPPPIQQKIPTGTPIENPAKNSSEDLRLDAPALKRPRIKRAENFHEYIEWLNSGQLVEVNNELTEVCKQLFDDAAQHSKTSQGEPPVVFAESSAPEGYKRTFIDVDLSQLTQPPSPQGGHRIDPGHQIRQDASKPHLRFDEETKPNPEEQATSIGDPKLPFSSVTIDEKTAQVVATISAAIASVIQERSEDDLRKQAEDYLKNVAIPIEMEPEPSEEPQQSSNHEEGTIDEIPEEMLNDIIRQRMAQLNATPNLGDLLQDRIEQFQEPGDSCDTIPFAREIKPDIEFVPQSISDLASQEPVLENQNSPMVVVNQNEDPSSVEMADENDIPINLAAWDVEDFRWPMVTNQMIVNGGTAISGLLQAIVEQLPQVPRRVAISGVGRIQGTTSIAIGIARWSAAAGYRTLLIDADVASPNMSQRLGMTSDISWLNGINDELPAAELIIRSKKSNLCVMPLASSVTRVTWPRFIFDNLGEVLDSVKQSFDLILIDAGPASQLLDELSTPEHLLDSVVVVNDSTDTSGLETIMTRLSTFGIDRFVLAENRVDEAKPNVA